jgi:hypothetical protein
VKIDPRDLNSTSFTLSHISLAGLHQSSYPLHESVVSLKSFAMKYFG